MKKIIVAVLAILAISAVKLKAEGLDCYSVSASTYAVTEAARLNIDISGTARISRILISNSLASQAQTVSFYDNATSTTAVTAAFTVDIASGTSGNQFIDLPFNVHSDYWKVSNVVVRKSATGSNVKVTYFYQ